MINNDLTFIIAKFLRKLPFKNVSDKFNLYRHTKIKKQLIPIFEETDQTFDKYDVQVFNNTIWIFWWQGEEAMPPIVKKCYQSVLKFRGKKEVVLITKDNIRDYTTISELIYSKLNSGKITFPHFSDILRANLLLNNGGLWMDATLFVTSSLDNIDLRKLYYRCGCSDDTLNVSYGRWTGFFMGGPQGMDLMSFMNLFYQIYWEKNDTLIDYFLIDYALDYAWDKNFSEFSSLGNKYNNTNPHMFELQRMLNQQYDKEKLEKMFLDTTVFKLSYKKKIVLDDENNVYNHLL